MPDSIFDHRPTRARTDFNNDGDRPASARWEAIVVMDEEDARRSDYQEAARRALSFQRRMFMFVCGATDPNERLLRFESVLIAMGYSDILNVRDGAALARLHHVTSATVNAIVRKFQDALELPPAPGQRDEETRGKQSDARNSQLKPSTNG